MQHHPLTKSAELLPELRAELERIRAKRAFNPRTYLDQKVDKLIAYIKQSGLSAAVIGMSGGVDSAVVLGILLRAKERNPDVLKLIQPLSLPTHAAEVGQMAATGRVARLCKQWKVNCPICNLHSVHYGMLAEMESALDVSANNWAAGQLTSYIRTPALYFATSLLTTNDYPAFVAGTTNRDEGAYLGYVGKASDGMVDIQLIADLHKSEVYALARHLGVTDEIINAIPSGEMYDGRVDEEVFGAPYDFVELYLSHKCVASHGGDAMWNWSDAATEQYYDLATNIESLHEYNAHKYLVGSPAIHLNVLESAVPGGWEK